MINWTYNAENYKGNNYQLIPPGDYRVRIESAEEKVSKTSGKEMIELTLKVNGHSQKLWHYVVFDNSTPEATKRTDSNLGQIFESFGIADGDLNIENWVGKIGAARIKHVPDNRNVNRMQARISFFLRQDKQVLLEEWQRDEIIQPEMAKLEDNDEPEMPF